MENTEYNDITKTGTQGLEGLKGVNTQKDNFNQFFNSLGSMNLTQLNETFSPEGYSYIGNQLAEAGYGESKYDKHAVTLSDLRDLNETRAQQQSGWAQIGAGLTKMSILATTTFVDGILGSLAGIINLGYQAATGNIHSAGEAFWSFIDNPFSEMLTKINEEAESWIPNYYTQEEQNSPWYSNIISANFLGDKFLKNVGFTIGAAGAALLTGGAAGRVLIKKSIRDAFKGVVVNSAGKQLKTGAEIYKAYKAGDAIMDGAKLTEDLAKSAKKLRNAERRIKLIAGVASAAGEGRIEAINNVNEWKKNEIAHLEEQHNNYPDMLEEQMYQEHPEWFSVDSQGNRFISNFEGARYYQEQIAKEKENYDKARIQIDKEKVAIGNSIFGLNLALLSGSNIWQWGRALTGSYTAARTGKSLVKGSIKEGFEANKDLVWKTRLRAISNPFMEMQEEMSQAAIAEGSGMWKSSKLNHDFGSFYGGKIDPDAEEDVQGWLSSIVNGFTDTYSNADRWEEGFIGFVTGLLGIPKIKLKTKENGKKGLSVKFDGEFWQGFKDAKEYAKEGKEIADYLNTRVQSDEFINYYQGTIRHTREGNRMDEAAEQGDEFEFKNAKHSQIISDAIMFEKAGKLQEFLDMIDDTAVLSDEDIEQIKLDTIDKKTGKSIFDGKTNEQIKEQIKKQAKNTRETVEKYAKISTDLRALYGNNISQDALEELIWGMSQVDNWETRMGQMYENIRETLKGVAQELKEKHGTDVEVVLNNLIDFQNAFLGDSNLVDKINEIIDDTNATVGEKEADIINAIKEKERQRKANNSALGGKIANIRKKTSKIKKRFEKRVAKLQKEKAKIQKQKDAALKAREEVQKLFDEFIALNKNKSIASEAIQKLQEELSQYIDEGSEKLNEGTTDVSSAFQPFLDSLDKALSDIEEELQSKELRDKRYKKGYVAKFVEDENGRLVPEEEAAQVSEARKTTREANESLAKQIIKLKESIESLEETKINPIDVEKTAKQLIDMIKIMAARDKFLNTYKQLEENPQLFDTKFQEELEKATAKHRENRVKKEIKKIKKEDIKNVQDLREVLNNIEDKEEEGLISDILEQLKKDASDELKQIIEDFENIEEMRSILNSIGETIHVTTEQQVDNMKKAYAVINNTLDEAKTFNEAKRTLSSNRDELKSTDPEVADILDTITKKYDEISKSKSSKKKDKKAKSKVKKKSNPEEEFSEDDDNDDDDDNSGEDNDNNEESKPKKKRSILDSLDEDDPFANENNEEPQSEPEQGSSEAFEDEEIIKTLKDMEEDELEDIVNGKGKILKGLSAKDKSAVKKLAKNILDKKKNPLANFGRAVGAKETNSEDKEKGSRTTESVHRSWAATGYNIDEAKSNRRKATLYRSKLSDALRALGAYDFVDSGRLGDLLYDNSNLPIYYIVAPSTDGLENVVLLGVEVTPDVKAINPITAQNGKKYQIVGSLGSYSNDARASKNIKAILNEIKNERAGSTNKASRNSKYFVSSKYINEVSHIYSGRMIKSTENDPEIKQRKLKDILNGEKPLFGFYYSDSDFRIPGLSEKEMQKVVLPNTNNLNPREGSVWLMTKEADGRYYAKAVSVRRFTNAEWNFEEHKNTRTMKLIKTSIETILNPEASDYERLLARDNLESLLYFDKYKIVFTGDVVSIKSIDGKNESNNIGKDAEDTEEKVQDFIDELEKLNLRFQISPGPMSSDITGIYVEDIIESDIVSTDLVMLHNVNASFDMPLLDVTTGKPVTNVKPSEIRGHTGKKGINNTNSVTSVFVSSVRYLLNNDNTVTDLNGGPVSDKITEQVLFKRKVDKKDVQPVDGNPDLYVSAYSNSKKFGFHKKKLVEGEELEELLKEANKKAQKQEAEKNMNSPENHFADENNEEDNDDDLIGTGDIQEGSGLFEDSNEQQNEDNLFADEDNNENDEGTPKKESSNDNLTETFNPKAREQMINSEDLQELLDENEQLLIDNGFSTPQDFIQAATAKGIDVNSIKTIEQLESALNQMKCAPL